MKFGVKAPRVLAVFVLLLSVAAVGAAALVEDTGRTYSILEKAFYLTAEQGAWIRAGLHFEIISVTIPADRKPLVTFRLTDDGEQPLDRDGKVTPGRVSTSFILAYLPNNANQYVSYTVRTQKSPITGVSAVQASSDSGGTYVSQGNGTYIYRFGTQLPAGYDTTTTHTLGMYGSRNLSEFGLPTYYDNQVKHFVPGGNPVTRIRDVVGTAACNQCHDPLALHGGSRRNIEVCILCHTPQTWDPDTGNTVDMPVMTHKIHMGPNLPSGEPYIIIGHNQSVHDYSEVTYPQDIRNCEQCHKDTTQVNQWLLNPTRATCGSCHDDVDFKTGKNHAGGIQPDDKYCGMCHWPESDREYDSTIKGAHTVPHRSTQLRHPKWELLSITNSAPGQKPSVKFKIIDKNGKPMKPSEFANPNGRLRLDIAGPNTDYRWYVQETADRAAYDEATGTATWNFANAIPADAKGSYTVAIEGRLNTTVNAGTPKEFVHEESPVNVTLPFAVTDQKAVARRTVVDQAKCNKCHDFLELHGGNRNQVSTCVVCHNPTNTDAGRRPASDLPAEAIDMKIMVHKIHTGRELNGEYSVYGFGGSAIGFNEVTYPGDRRNCLTCHDEGTYTVPLPKTVTPSTTPRNFWDPTLPTAAACLGCHDSIEAAAHAFINTTSFGGTTQAESCAVCHKETAEVAVSKAHAR